MRAKIVSTCVAGAAMLFMGVGCKSKDGTALTTIPGQNLADNGGGSNTNTNGNNTGTGLGNGNTIPGNTNPNGNNTNTNTGVNPDQPIPSGFVPQRDVFASVHFEYDSAELRNDDMELVRTVAAYLVQNPSHVLLVEGHCDERGTEEYNLSLGERRALAVAEALANLGVSAPRLYTQSYGEKIPVSEADTKEARAQNRRGEFVVFMPPQAGQEPPAERINLVPGQ